MKDFRKKQRSLIKHVEQLDEVNAVKLAAELLEDGMEPLYLLDLINQGMNRVGQLYENKRYYIADLIMAGLIFKQVLELDKMTAHFNIKHNNKIGSVVLGTVKGDIHDIGKDIIRGMLEANGFEVVDVGVDVPKEHFLKKYEEYKPDILGLSGVLTNTVDTMKEVVDAFAGAGLRDKVKIIVGGNHLTEESCKFIGADNFANDASVGVKVCKEWMNCTNKQGVNNNG
ncbi:5-methyltetrahydrofolate--homocysteine methyltransferase [Desulfocucumis palustris]|uniref:5-methyltetrahydrofolate--homocysteine methyltransferase n=1 Tax=Desulfocucumis palustris TaxID=1898651 RepID=A0A2L2X8Q9_9FIRM|nr:cobalamin-dependent protein [Desulfocucumis palustris]GBF32599.1 5-methyltetrahydrofolate--homocysteine methyltransferase [Desulfocucumis palustris]